MKRLRNVAIITIVLVMALCINTSSFAKTVVITTDGLNLRREASQSADVLDVIYLNEEVECLEEIDGWYKVSYNGLTGYISKDFAKVKGEENSNPPTTQTDPEPEQNPEPEPQPEPTNEQNAEITNPSEQTNPETNTTIKSSKKMKFAENTVGCILPLINANVICNFEKDKVINAISFVNNWVYVESETISAWVRTDKLVDSEQTENPQGNTQEPNNSEPGDDIEEPTITGQVEVTPIEPKTMYVKEPSIYVRSGPATTYDVLDTLVVNNTVTVTGKINDWYQVKINDKIGYIADWLLADNAIEVTSRGNLDRDIVTTPMEGIDDIEETTFDKEITSKGEEIVNFAKQYLGCKYVYGGSGPSVFDCSGFTMYVYKNFGVALSHSATAQSKKGTYVAKEDLQPGDLVFFKDYETMNGIGHCGIYIGGGDFIHASSGTGYCVKISTLLSGSYNTRYETARRVI